MTTPPAPPPAPPAPPGGYGPGGYGPPPGGYGGPSGYGPGGYGPGGYGPGGYGPPPGGYGPPPGGYSPPPDGYGPPPPPRPPSERPPTPWWAALLAVLGVVVVVGAVAVGVTALLLQAATRTSELAVDETGIREIRISGVTGGADISTDPGADGDVTGTARVTTSFQEADVTVERQGDVLLLDARCPDQGWPRRCEIGYDLVVDPDTDLVVDIVTGGLRADGLAGDVDVDITAGGVLLTASTSGTVLADVTTGGVALEFDEAPDDVRVTATTGGVVIGVPDDGTAYAVSTAVSVGDASVDVPTDPASPRTIEASTSVGGIDINAGSPEQYDGSRGWDHSG